MLGISLPSYNNAALSNSHISRRTAAIDRLTHGGASVGAVPVLFGVAKALANGNHLLPLELLEHVLCQVIDGLLVDIVADDEEVVVGGRLSGDGLVDNVF